MSLVHFTRKYRSNSFESLVGQESIIKFLKNSLFKGIYYPVYLFSGIRGTGKTSSARLLAASLLCHNRDKIKTDSSFILPCKNCYSCEVFFKGEHADFYEFDAASHSGVDTIRDIIDNVILAPLVSDKKIYVIDEVHMLSKAAFNACLKVMEEPPSHVHFILATTDSEKVLDTIKSRSIHLLFKSFSLEDITSYLIFICIKENIIYTENALRIISIMAEGSMRDALNHFERIYISEGNILYDPVLKLLGMPSEDIIKNYVDAYENANNNLFISIKKDLTLYSPILLLSSLRNYLTLSLSGKSNSLYLALLKKLYEYERWYVQTSYPIGVLELIFYERVQVENSKETLIVNSNEKKKKIVKEQEVTKIDSLNKLEAKEIQIYNNSNDFCRKFIAELILIDTVVSSIFQQAQLFYNREDKKVYCDFDSKFSFYKDFLEEKKKKWHPLFVDIFGLYIELIITFSKKIETPLKENFSEKNKNKIENIVKNDTLIINNKLQEHISVATSSSFNNKSFSEYKKVKKHVPKELYPDVIKEIAMKFNGTAEYME